MKLLTILLLTALSVTLWADPPSPTVIDQKNVGKNTCGPCAYLNSLLYTKNEKLLKALKGKTPEDKARDFCNRFGSLPSVYKGRPDAAYAEADGVSDFDLLAMTNKMRLESNSTQLSGAYLLRNKNEKATEFLQRVKTVINNSINAGFCPLLSIRSAKPVLEGDGTMRWNRIAGHWICIVSAKQLSDDMLLLEAADSNVGKVINLVVYCGESMYAVVPMSSKYNAKGLVNWHWEKSQRCLFVCAPSLSFSRFGAKWFERNYVAAGYLISHPEIKKNSTKP